MDDAVVIDLNAVITASQAAAYAGRTVQVIINWRNRGDAESRLKPATEADGTPILDDRGKPMYRLRDVARIDAIKRSRAAAMAAHLTRAAA